MEVFTNTQNHNNGTADQLNFVVNALVSQNQNTAFWLASQHQICGGNFELTDHVTRSVPCTNSNLRFHILQKNLYTQHFLDITLFCNKIKVWTGTLIMNRKPYWKQRICTIKSLWFCIAFWIRYLYLNSKLNFLLQFAFSTNIRIFPRCHVLN